LHFGNPEMNADAILLPLFYFSFGFFASYITLRDNSLELALGVHAANNLFSGLVANYAMSALPTPSIFMVNELDAVYGLVSSVLAMTAFYLIVFKPWRRPQPVEGVLP
jgi:membrane protease YdiL (CAAX protease family)